MGIEEDFAEALKKDPKLLEKLKKSADLQDFKDKFNIERATPLKCPACSQWQISGGSLWIHKDDPTLFTCRKCKLTFRVECITLPTNELIIQMRAIQKGDEQATLNWDKRIGDTDEDTKEN